MEASYPFNAAPLIDHLYFNIVYSNDFAWSFGETRARVWTASHEAQLYGGGSLNPNHGWNVIPLEKDEKQESLSLPI